MKKILIIVPDGGMLFESAGIADILMQANRLHPEGAREICYQVKLATTQPHQVIHGQSGLNLLADHRLHEIDPREPLDTIMITGRGQNPQEGMAVVDWLRLAAPHARRIVSICGGAMLLAQTGLLDGRRATTHWKLLETMQAEFPQIRVEGGPLYIQDEHIWTSGGVSSGFDLTLALVEEDYGFSLARDIAQDFVMYLRRPGGQLQFSRYNLQQTATQGPINDLLAWLLENLTADLSVDKLAEKVAMSPRNFTRVFTRETGASPARYVAEARLAAARQRLEQTHETLDRIAEQTGFGSSINLRRLFEKLQIVAINDLTDSKTLAHLLKYDSLLGKLDAEVTAGEGGLVVDGKPITVFSERNPASIPWRQCEVDIVIEATGLFTDREKAAVHIHSGGAKRVIISAPGKNDDLTIVMGVNESLYSPDKHYVISNGSCTTNGLAPAAQVLHQHFGIKHGLMNTTHAYTNSQALHDQPEKDLRGARAAALSIVPYSSGAAKALGKVIPELDGRLTGYSLRVPVPVVSIVDLTVTLERDVTVEEVNNAFREAAAAGPLKGILGYSDEPLVSSDYQGDPRSSIIDGLSTLVIGGNMVKILAWYDNEWGFSNRLVDLALMMAKRES
ncbi:type I glyceraldehyde-3-phosphate dehydrogenase [Klebsiella pneumoniae]|nr:type I glyceraldehyde-3-phosphate dehydrogenase [Klebsiella pneumoniae]KDH45011.1 glyceraldehyde-3-phosphate dehydrogenase, type I [Klebsiella pneumoniae BWH 45]